MFAGVYNWKFIHFVPCLGIRIVRRYLNALLILIHQEIQTILLGNYQLIFFHQDLYGQFISYRWSLVLKDYGFAPWVGYSILRKCQRTAFIFDTLSYSNSRSSIATDWSSCSRSQPKAFSFWWTIRFKSYRFCSLRRNLDSLRKPKCSWFS